MIEAASADEAMIILDVILAGSVTRATDAAAELCNSATVPKPYEARIAARRSVSRLMAAGAIVPPARNILFISSWPRVSRDLFGQFS